MIKTNLKADSEVDADCLVPGAGCYETVVGRELARPHNPTVTYQSGHLVRMRSRKNHLHVINNHKTTYNAGSVCSLKCVCVVCCILAVVPPPAKLHTRAVSSEEHVTTRDPSSEKLAVQT